MKKQVKQLPIRYANSTHPEKVIGCPVCGFEYNNIEATKFQSGHDNYETDYGAIFRGDAVILEMVCEEGHKYNIVFGKHKGYVYMFAEALK